jgi:hypothetical protein
MKRLALTGGCLAVLLFGASTARAADVVRFTEQGDFAGLDWSADTTFLSLSVSRTAEGKLTNTFLSFFLAWLVVNPDYESCAPFCEQFQYNFAYGAGVIPNGDFTASQNRSVLSTNIANNPNFWIDSSEPTFSVGEGIIQLTWTGNDLFSSRINTTGSDRFGTVSRHFNSRRTFASARATGSFLGESVEPAAQGSRGTSHGSQICIARGNDSGACGGGTAPPPPRP